MDKYESIVARFTISFRAMLGRDGKIKIASNAPIEGGIDFTLSIDKDLDPQNVKAYISGFDMINPAINKVRYDQFFLSRGLKVQPGFCTFEPYVEDQVVHIKLDTSGAPFDPGV